MDGPPNSQALRAAKGKAPMTSGTSKPKPNTKVPEPMSGKHLFAPVTEYVWEKGPALYNLDNSPYGVIDGKHIEDIKREKLSVVDKLAVKITNVSTQSRGHANCWFCDPSGYIEGHISKQLREDEVLGMNIHVGAIMILANVEVLRYGPKDISLMIKRENVLKIFPNPDFDYDAIKAVAAWVL